jgi:hypothetical protein
MLEKWLTPMCWPHASLMLTRPMGGSRLMRGGSGAKSSSQAGMVMATGPAARLSQGAVVPGATS